MGSLIVQIDFLDWAIANNLLIVRGALKSFITFVAMRRKSALFICSCRL